jgi:nucleotidyltransferase substrate binding protein (TIGR01987 family)
MERLRERLTVARRALANLEELAVRTSVTPVERDAAIQRFEYSFEAVWQAARLFLRHHEGLDLASPKAVIRACRRVALLDEGECGRALEMADDRNLTVHTYNESLAIAIFARLAEHARVIDRWLTAMEQGERI